MGRKGWLLSGALVLVGIGLWQWPRHAERPLPVRVPSDAPQTPLSPPPSPSPTAPPAAAAVKAGSNHLLAGLQLIALFQTDDAALASAVIVIDNTRIARYRVGERLDAERRIKALLPDRALIEGAHGVQVLQLAPLSGAAQAAVQSAVAEPEGEASPPALTPREQVLEELDLTPVTPGSADGYLVGERLSTEVTARSGVKPGDTVVSLNGYPLGEAAWDELAWQSFESSGKAVVRVQRGGETFYVNYPEPDNGQ